MNKAENNAFLTSIIHSLHCYPPSNAYFLRTKKEGVGVGGRGLEEIS